ncbi:MAG: ABC transporter permease [Spirochaetaceae bacterium]|nr:MAG: ABC transporter permease [Spirochaetaceae bacterium]
MKQFLTVFHYSFIRNCREPSTILELVLLPLGLILVLGGALGGAFDARDIGPTPVAYVIESESPIATTVRDFLHREDVGRYMATSDAGTIERATELLAAREVFAVVHVPPGFADSPDSAGIRLIERAGNELRTGIVRAVLRNYTAGANVTAALLTGSPARGAGPEAGAGPGRGDPPDVGYAPMPALFEVREISREGRAPGSFDFYSVSMLVLFLMYVAGYSVDALREDILEPIGLRVRTTAIRPWTHLSARFTANATSGLVQAAVIILVTRVAFGANWGERPMLLAAMVAAITLFAVSLGALVLALARDGQKALSVVNAIAIGSLILSGGAIPLGAVSPGFRAIQRLLPHYQGQTALLAMVFDRAPAAIPEAFVYFLGGTVAALALTVVLARRSA